MTAITIETIIVAVPVLDHVPDLLLPVIDEIIEIEIEIGEVVVTLTISIDGVVAETETVPLPLRIPMIDEEGTEVEDHHLLLPPPVRMAYHDDQHHRNGGRIEQKVEEDIMDLHPATVVSMVEAMIGIGIEIEIEIETIVVIRVVAAIVVVRVIAIEFVNLVGTFPPGTSTLTSRHPPPIQRFVTFRMILEELTPPNASLTKPMREAKVETRNPLILDRHWFDRSCAFKLDIRIGIRITKR